MEYLIVGTGGTGGALGGFLQLSGKRVDFIARGKHGDALRQNGLTLHSDLKGNCCLKPASVWEMEQYTGSPDVIFVCVKGYSLDETVPFLQRIAGPKTMVIPILNIYGTGSVLAEQLPNTTVLDGCIYIVAYIESPGVIAQRGPTFRVVFGPRDHKITSGMEEIRQDLANCGINVQLSTQIQRDCFQKYACIAPMASSGAYFDVTMGELRQDPEKRAVYARLTAEISALANAMGIPFQEDVVAQNLHLLDTMTPDSTASMQKDLKKGGQSEIDGLVFEPVRLGRRLGVPVPTFEKIAAHFGFTME